MKNKTVLMFNKIKLVDISDGDTANYVLEGTLYASYFAHCDDNSMSRTEEMSRLAQYYLGRVVQRIDSPEWDSRGSLWFI